MSGHDERTTETGPGSTLKGEMEAKAGPLSPVEKKLIGYSLGIGAVLLVLLVLLTGAYKF